MGSVAERLKALEDEISLTDRRGEWDVELAAIRAEVEAVARDCLGACAACSYDDYLGVYSACADAADRLAPEKKGVPRDGE